MFFTAILQSYVMRELHQDADSYSLFREGNLLRVLVEYGALEICGNHSSGLGWRLIRPGAGIFFLYLPFLQFLVKFLYLLS